MANGKVFCITGIDTDIGKTVVTGLIGRYLVGLGLRVISQKIVQTGCIGMSEDILRHRQIMGSAILDEDRQGLTCPYVFSTPCSPHLAARLAGRKIEPEAIGRATDKFSSTYDVVLLEGAGGLLAPLNEETTLLDYLELKGYPLILVSTPRLGSINHTLLALEVVYRRGMHLCGIVYNRFQETDPWICKDSAEVFSRYLKKYGFPDCVIPVDRYSVDALVAQAPDFSKLFQERPLTGLQLEFNEE